MMLGLGLLARKGEKAARAIKGRRADREECFSEYATSWAECKSEWKELNEQERAQSRWMYDNCEAFAASVDPWSSAFAPFSTLTDANPFLRSGSHLQAPRGAQDASR